jgi:hypothetical protein
MVAPEVVWHVPGERPMAGVINGREALLTWLAELPSLNKNRAGNRRPALALSPSDESPDGVSAVDGR